MGSYIIKRTAYSVLIIIGVMIVTFLLFRVAAGDPAAALLGKNPSPKSVEQLRSELGSDKPLFWGKYRRTEAFTSVSFKEKRTLPGVKIPEDAVYEQGCIKLDSPQKELVFSRNFSLENTPQVLFLTTIGKKRKTAKIDIKPSSKEIKIIPDKGSVLLVEKAEFFREQDSAWNSQFADSLKELISFNSRFPYVSFFNFGRTLTTREPVKKIILRGIWPSLFVMFPIFIGELLIGIILALFATAFKGTWVDKLIVLLSIVGMSVSYLVFIIFGQWYLGYYYNLFPVWGYGTIAHLMLPVIIGIVSGLGGGVRFYRTVFVNELSKEYLKTARSKGCSEWSVYGRHLLRNAAIPIITRASTVLPFLFTGSLLLETFFGIPGLGYAGINALNNSDLQMIKALVIIGAALFVFINLIADIAYAWVDPRIRLK